MAAPSSRGVSMRGFCRYEFDDGLPAEPCRPYTDEEWRRLMAAVMGPSDGGAEVACQSASDAGGDAAAPSASETPVAVLISGIPGGGKSSSLRALFAAGVAVDGADQTTADAAESADSAQTSFSAALRHLALPPLSSFAVVDFDELRLFHEQFVTESNRSDQPDTAAAEAASSAAGVSSAASCMSTSADAAAEASSSTSSDSMTLPRSDIRRSWRDLVAWFMLGTDFERIMFRADPASGRGLLPALMAARRNFVLECVLDHSGCFSFVQHVAARGYRIVLVHVHTPVEVAARRAEARARITGRWSSPQFIASRSEGVREWFAPMARFVLHETVGGAVALFDNTAEGQPPTLIYPAQLANSDAHASVAASPAPVGSSSSSYPLWAMFQLDTLHVAPVTSVAQPLHPAAVDLLHYSRQTRRRLFASLASGIIEAVLPAAAPPELTHELEWRVDLCVAGGLFKSLLKGRHPRDIDIFACSDEDRARLHALLQAHTPERLRAVRNQRYQTQFELAPPPPCAPVAMSSLIPPPPLVVELAKRTAPAELSAKLARFDIALAAVGVRLQLSWRPSGESSGNWHLNVEEVFEHPLWVPSLELRQPLLLEPLPNASFLLATAERCCRYAQELGWSDPLEQLGTLRREFERMCAQPLSDFPVAAAMRSAAGSESLPTFDTTRGWLLANYRCTTQGGEARQRVCSFFQLQHELESANTADAHSHQESAAAGSADVSCSSEAQPTSTTGPACSSSSSDVILPPNSIGLRHWADFLTAGEREQLLQLYASTSERFKEFERPGGGSWRGRLLSAEEDPTLSAVLARAAVAVGLPSAAHIEAWAVAYARGQHHPPHNDARGTLQIHPDNPRAVTLLVYLSDAIEGGWTLFPNLPALAASHVHDDHAEGPAGWRFQPRASHALYWRNAEQQPDGSWMLCDQALHAGLPVPDEEKFCLTRQLSGSERTAARARGRNGRGR